MKNAPMPVSIELVNTIHQYAEAEANRTCRKIIMLMTLDGSASQIPGLAARMREAKYRTAVDECMAACGWDQHLLLEHFRTLDGVPAPDKLDVDVSKLVQWLAELWSETIRQCNEAGELSTIPGALKLTKTSSTDDLARWLEWNDSNGEYQGLLIDHDLAWIALMRQTEANLNT